jgi:hypothetical protein
MACNPVAAARRTAAQRGAACGSTVGSSAQSDHRAAGAVASGGAVASPRRPGGCETRPGPARIDRVEPPGRKSWTRSAKDRGISQHSPVWVIAAPAAIQARRARVGRNIEAIAAAGAARCQRCRSIVLRKRPSPNGLGSGGGSGGGW